MLTVCVKAQFARFGILVRMRKSKFSNEEQTTFFKHKQRNRLHPSKRARIAGARARNAGGARVWQASGVEGVHAYLRAPGGIAVGFTKTATTDPDPPAIHPAATDRTATNPDTPCRPTPHFHAIAKHTKNTVNSVSGSEKQKKLSEPTADGGGGPQG